MTTAAIATIELLRILGASVALLALWRYRIDLLIGPEGLDISSEAPS